MTGFPILKVVLDGQSGEAGLQTRIESFIDILTFQKKGGYLHE
jgi:predicted nucleotide-binding protein (sugar kinase/HSP70/actin superfamily)